MQLLHNLEETLFVVLALVLMTMKTELKSNSQGAVNSEGEGFNLIVWQIKSRVNRTIRMTDMNLPVSFLAWKSVCKNNFSITKQFAHACNHDDQEARIAQSQTPFLWPFSVVRARKIIKKNEKIKKNSATIEVNKIHFRIIWLLSKLINEKLGKDRK